MLDKPKYGWSHITIGDWTERCSYLDDVPRLLLETMESAFRTHRPAAATFDAEGWEYTLVFDFFVTHVISNNCKDGYIYNSIEVNLETLASELMEDIRRDIDDWAEFDVEPSESEISEHKEALLVCCDILEKRVDEYTK